ncbi:3'-5' exonuclease [Porphyromonas sp.]|uniref:3'-5' exonuclease n=1 Tax=Porphyromonas sp. TaxID=1924944 RepID=UPI0026DB47ED|nr:3'-5' exonuclease [Porphyromonas sp.]MDO4771300.1 3'-5' exonuclease [Porphyromonas sp.]
MTDNTIAPLLNLDRPIVFFDLETTGVDAAKDRVVEISMLKVLPDGSEEEYYSLIHPGMHIPPSSSAVHGITDEKVADAPRFEQVAREIAGFFEGADIGGYNCNKFDVPLLVEEFLRAGVPVDFKTRRIIDVQVIFHKREQRTLSAAYKFYCDKDLTEAHTAAADTRATYEVLRGQLGRYADLPNDVQALDEYTSYHKIVDFAGRLIYNEHGQEVINFGKHKGKLAEVVLREEPTYYDWIMKSDFARDTQMEFMKIKMRMDQNKR